MIFKIKKKLNRTMYVCPFCKKEIVSSYKTEIHYRGEWINGCNDCFSLSIDLLTVNIFQTKNYSKLLI